MQNNLNIANQSRTNLRQALNNALASIASQQSGSGDPSVTYPFQIKIDTSVTPAIMYIRNSGDTEWQGIGYIASTTGQLIMYNATDADTLDGKHYSDFSEKLLHDVTLAGTDTYTGTLPAGVSGYYDKMKCAFVVPNPNAAANPTVNLSSTGAKKVLDRNGAAIAAGNFAAGKAICEYSANADSGSGAWLLLNFDIFKISQSGTEIYALATGTDTYAATLSPAITEYKTGFEIHIKIPNANTSTVPTLNGKKIFKPIAAALIAGDLEANGHYTFIYDASLDSNNGGWIVKNPKTIGTTENADKLDGYHAGHASGQVPVSDGTVCSNLNADMVDGANYGGTTIRWNGATISLGNWVAEGIPYLNYNEYVDD